MSRNEAVLNSLPSATYRTGIPAYLTDEQGNVLFSFLYPPEGDEVSRKIIYAEPQVALASVQPYQYISTGGRMKKFSNLLMESFGARKSLRPLLEQIQSLAVADIPNGKYAPPIVYFLWGTEAFGPAVLCDEISWTEELFVGGEPALVKLNITLREVPPSSADQTAPTIQGTRSAPSEEEQQTTAAVNRLTGLFGQTVQQAISTFLTSRQQSEGTAKATAFIKANVNQLSPEIRQALRQNVYSVATDSNGTVTFTRTRSGIQAIVGSYDGSTFTPIL